MYKNNTIGVVVPAFNEEKLIARMVNTIPDYIDFIIIIDDASTDDTYNIIKKFEQNDPRIKCFRHEVNGGVGAAVSSGYQWCKQNGIDITVVMNADCQMDPLDLPNLLDPIVDNLADYTKGNRLITGEAWNKIPHIRYLGNSILTLMTKICSGYWHVTDSQSGYTALNRRAIDLLPIDRIYKGYGMTNDILVRLNIVGMRVLDVPINPIYGVGEESHLKLHQVTIPIFFLLIRCFFRRLFQRYIMRDFHPLVFFYLFGFFVFFVDFFLGIRLFYMWHTTGRIPTINALAVLLCTLSGMQLVLFAMLFDMEANRDLKGKSHSDFY
jgi:glycosyltransferase involved in cell wall biosynthesis